MSMDLVLELTKEMSTHAFHAFSFLVCCQEFFVYNVIFKKEYVNT